MRQIVVGLAGHIDHGKTSIIKALTGVNTDRLEEEVHRGMTIDIGFAFLNDEITLIDVPGHEKFVKNMMAGVSGVDAAMLVIAADDGVMPQTKEHFDILKLLDVQVGCVALNKTDLVDEEWLELVEMDIQDLIDGTFMEDAPIIQVSAVENSGFDRLSDAILKMCEKVPEKNDRGIFRMPVDRVFTIKGFGTVTTGTVSSGSIKVGDTVELLPGGKTAKIRNLQSHAKPVSEVHLGDRAAINLQGIDRSELIRGHQLSMPLYFQPTTQMGVSVSLLNSIKKPIKQNQRIRIHLGTQEVMARIAIIDTQIIEAGQKKAAILRLETPLIASHNDRFIIRTYSPIETIGGGTILTPEIKRKWKIAKEEVQALFTADESEQLELLAQFEGSTPLAVEQVKLIMGLSLTTIEKLVTVNPNLNWAEYKTDRWLVTEKQTKNLQTKVTNFLKIFHKKNRHKSGALKAEITQHLKGNDRFIEHLLSRMATGKMIDNSGKFWSLPDYSIKLSSEENELLNRLFEILDAEGFTSSRLSELAEIVGESETDVKTLLNIAEQRGDLLRLEGNLIFTKKNFDALKKKVLAHFQKSETLKIPVFKELAETSRKYAVPLMEYFDKMKITYRAGDVRKLVSKSG